VVRALIFGLVVGCGGTLNAFVMSSKSEGVKDRTSGEALNSLNVAAGNIFSTA